MPITVNATYQNGVLRLEKPLPLAENERVEVVVNFGWSRVRRSAGLMGWTGSQEDADFVASSPELDPQVR